MPGNIIEVGSLLDKIRPNRQADAEETINNSDVAKYVRSLQSGKSKNDVTGDLEARVENIKGFGADDLEIQENPEERGEFDWLISEGKDATVSGKAKNEIAALVATLSDNLGTVSNPNTALIFKKDTSEIMELLMNSLSLKSEATEENLNYVQRETRALLRDALSRGRASQSIDAASIDYVTRMFSSNEAEAVKATVDLIRQVGLKKLTKENAGFVGALSRSYGALGKSLSKFVFERVRDLTTKPLAMTSESADELDTDVKNQIAALKQEIFNETFSKIEERFEKRKDKIIRKGEEGAEDAKFLQKYRAYAEALFTAEDREAAETAAQQLTSFLSEYATKADSSTTLMREAENKARELSRQKSAREERVVVINNKLISTLLDQDRLNDEVVQELSEHVLNIAKKELAEEPAPIVVSKGDVEQELNSIKPTNGTTEVQSFDGSQTISGINSSHIDLLISILDRDGNVGSNDRWGWFSSSPKLNGKDVSPKQLLDFIRAKIKARIEDDNTRKRESANAITNAKDNNKSPQEILQLAQNIYLPLSQNSSEGVKGLADRLKEALLETKAQAKNDKKYYETFLKNVNSWILTPILTKSPTIAKTNGAALMASIIDSDGTLNEDFFNVAFESFNLEATNAIKHIKENTESEIEALKKTAEAKAQDGTTKIVKELGVDSYADLLTALGTALSADDGNEISEFNKLVQKANLRIDEDAQKLLDLNDSNLTGYDLHSAQAKRAALISNQIVALRNLSESTSSMSRLSDEAKSQVRRFIEKIDAENSTLRNVNRDTNKRVGTIASRLNREYFAKIADKEKEAETLAEIEVSENVWELKDNQEINFPDSVRDVFKTLDSKFRQGLKNILGSMGLFHPAMISILRDRVANIDEDSASSGLLSTVHAQLTALANDSQGPASKASDSGKSN